MIETDVEILATVEQGQGRIIETNISPEFQERRIMDLNIPAKAIIAIIQRGMQVIIPKGTTIVKPGDQLMVFTNEENCPRVKEFFRK